MKNKWAIMLLLALILMSSGTLVIADEPAPKDPPAEKVAIPVVVQPNDIRNYKLSVGIKGCVGIMDSTPMIVDALNTMRIRHQYGKREGDGLLLLDISARDVQVTVNGEKVPTGADRFPKLTLLLDKSWNISKVFGAERASEGQVPGLNYSTLIMLFFIPDGDKPHTIGETWASKVKALAKPDEVTVKSTIRSVTETNENRRVSVHQEFAWPEQKLDGGRSVRSTAVVDSVFDLATGKLLKSNAECQLPFSDPSQPKPENQNYKATTKIDLSLE